MTSFPRIAAAATGARRRLSTTLLAMAAAGVLGGATFAQEAAPLLPNGSFEETGQRGPRNWRRQTWGGEGQLRVAETGRTGARSVMIESQQGGDLSWTVTVPVEPFARYRLSGWIKTDNLQTQGGGRGALFNLHNKQGVATPAIKGTQDWQKVEVEFDSESDDSLQINCLFGGWGLATGRAWFDEVQLEQIGAAERPALKVAVNAAQTSEPISPYVYGQFIEHLGRCIYGGIWAEMLEDRKFYFPITAEYQPYRALNDSAYPVVGASPWRIIGAADSVTMEPTAPFVGEHTPRVAAGAGIEQLDLGVVEGREYVGYAWLKAAERQATCRVALVWGNSPASRHTVDLQVGSDDYVQYAFRFRAGATVDRARLALEFAGAPVLVGTVSLMPADNVQGMRADTLELLKQLDSPVYRWPGGNFVSGYDWRDGVGPRDRRPPRKNPAWTGVEHNDFGLDEFMVFCRLLNTEPYIAVNSGLGGVENACAELEYANGPADSPQGQRRAANGHPEPYGVKFWGVGNEMYGGWQLGHMPLADYVKKHNEFAAALRAVDPSVELVGVGDVGPWSEGMMRNCADNMDLISEHFYCQERPGLLAHVRQMTDSVKLKADGHRRYRRELDSLQGKDIRIALDEWNYWYGPHVFGELGTRYFLRDALGIAAGIHEMARHSDLFYMANYAQTVNVIGCIKTSKTAAFMESTGHILVMYRKHFGQIPVATEASPWIDAQAALTSDRRQLTLAVVNPSLEAREIPLTIEGARLKGTGRQWQLADADPMAYNDVAAPQRLQVVETPVSGVGASVAVPACSVTLWSLDLE